MVGTTTAPVAGQDKDRRAIAVVAAPIQDELIYAPRWSADHHPWLLPGTTMRWAHVEVTEVAR